MSDKHRYELLDGDLLVIDRETGEVRDRITAPVGGGREGDTDEYVVIAEHPEYMHEDMRWSVTAGSRVRQNYGLQKGRLGVIAGQARSRKADRIFATNLMRAATEGRDLTGDDFEILIDNEGALIEFDDEPGVKHWFPGQSFGFDYVPNVVSQESIRDVMRVDRLYDEGVLP